MEEEPWSRNHKGRFRNRNHREEPQGRNHAGGIGRVWPTDANIRGASCTLGRVINNYFCVYNERMTTRKQDGRPCYLFLKSSEGGPLCVKGERKTILDLEMRCVGGHGVGKPAFMYSEIKNLVHEPGHACHLYIYIYM